MDRKLRRPGVCAVVRDRGGRVLVGRRSASNAVDPGKICMPGGKPEDGETLETAAARELVEETGMHPLSARMELLVDSPDGWICAFVAVAASGEPVGRDPAVGSWEWKHPVELDADDVQPGLRAWARTVAGRDPGCPTWIVEQVPTGPGPRIPRHVAATPEEMARFHGWRGVETPCPSCRGSGTRWYSSGATWRGGMGTTAPARGVCDVCWGSGDTSRPWDDLRALRDAIESIRGPAALEELARRAGVGIVPAEAAARELGRVVATERRRRKLPEGVDRGEYVRALAVLQRMLEKMA